MKYYEICNYEKCALIKQVLSEMEIPPIIGTKVDDKSLDAAYQKIMEGLQNRTMIEQNMPYYIQRFKEIVLP